MNRAINRHSALVVTIGGAAAACLVAVVVSPTLEAHKAVTSPYTYNDHVFPILRDKCGRCHVEGGPAPMSLLVYREKDGTGGAFSWAESIREMLVTETMPPWYADPRGPAIKHSHAMTAREVDIVVTWASGGTPEGDPAKRPVSLPPKPARWTLGQPDLVLRMPTPHELPASALEETVDVTLPTALTDTKWLKAADLLPGTPAMVRRAEIEIDDGQVLAEWEPGDDPVPAPSGAAFRLKPGANVRLRLFYKKPWQDEQQATSDQSSVGLYFTNAPLSGSPIDSDTIEKTNAGTASVTLEGSLAAASRVLAIRPQLDQGYESLEIVAVPAAGKRVPLLTLHAARPEWPRRYWLVDPIELPAGTLIEVSGTPADPDRGPLRPPQHLPLRVAIDVTPLQ